MSAFITFIIGIVAGFLAHALPMKISFKQRTIDDKIKVYDKLISEWVKMRNFIYSSFNGASEGTMPLEAIHEFDQMYGETQLYIGEAFLVCEDESLTSDINILNEKIYRASWCSLSLDDANSVMNDFKSEAMLLISRMREDVKASTRLEMSDFVHMFTGFFKNKK